MNGEKDDYCGLNNFELAGLPYHLSFGPSGAHYCRIRKEPTLKCSHCLQYIFVTCDSFIQVEMDIGFMTFHDSCWEDAKKIMKDNGMKVPEVITK